MDVSSTLSMVQVAAAYSVLKSANRQPELALQLLQQSLPLQTAGATAETPAATVQAPTPTGGPGQIIDTIA
jgi:hypothetical protein